LLNEASRLARSRPIGRMQKIGVVSVAELARLAQKAGVTPRRMVPSDHSV
jgi:hypothetical protein